MSALTLAEQERRERDMPIIIAVAETICFTALLFVCAVGWSIT